MNAQAALKSQYRASLAMLRECIEKCPDEVWTWGEHPRTFWRIAYHALYFAHLYLQPRFEDFQPWERHREQRQFLYGRPSPHDLPMIDEPYAKQDLMDYADYLVANLDEMLGRLDLDAPESGFSWYVMPKLDHQIVNIRHIQQHACQLSEHLYAADVDLDWIG
jgi:hypothetical protein